MYLRKYSVPLKMLAYGTALAGVTAWALSEIAHAESGAYVEATGNAAIFGDAHTDRWETDYNNLSWGASAAAGYCWTHFCLEGEVLHFRAGVDGGWPVSEEVEGAELGFTGIAGNAVWQFNTPLIFDPYVFAGVGLGYAGIDPEHRDGLPLVEGGAANAADICLLSQAGAGLKMPLTDNGAWEVFTEARYARGDFCSVTGVPHTSAVEIFAAGGGLRRQF